MRLLLLLLGIAALLALTGVLGAQRAMERNPLLLEQPLGESIAFYALASPSLDAPALGEGHLTVVAYLDLSSPPSALFLDLLPELTANPSLRIMVRPVLTLADLEERNNRYLYSKALWCAAEQDAYVTFWQRILTEQPKDLSALAQREDLAIPAFTSCMDGPDPASLLDDAIWSENKMGGLGQRIYIGIEGTDTTVFDGVPSYERLSRTIALHTLTIGG